MISSQVHTPEEGSILADKILADTMDQMRVTDEGADKVDNYPSLYQQFSQHRRLSEPNPTTTLLSKKGSVLQAYSKEGGMQKAEEVIANRPYSNKRSNFRAI